MPLALASLDEGPRLRTAEVGDKAARLAAARAAGLPVLPGVVVPAAAARPALDGCLEALRVGGSGAARLAAMEARIDHALAGRLEVAGGRLGDRLVVRSSSVLEADPGWAGAFTSYLDVPVGQLLTAVRGVWASAFARDPLERYEHAGLSPAQHHLAVLVQPHLEPDTGGVATVHPDGTVETIWVDGPPAGLLAGWEAGQRAVVDPLGRFRQSGTGSSKRLVRQVVELVHAVRETLGANHVEWASRDGSLVLLQIGTRPGAPQPAPSLLHPASPAILRDGLLRHVVRLLRRYPGPLGERVVLPWGAAAGPLAAPPDVGAAHDVAATLAEALARADDLIAQAWDMPATRGVETARRTLQGLHGPRAGDALARLGALRGVDPVAAQHVVGLVTSCGLRLAADGVLTAPGDVWHCDLQALLAGDARPPPAPPRQPDPWEPLVHGVVMATGERLRGLAAAGGSGAGVARVAVPGAAPPRIGRREVLVTPRPLPQLASLLYQAAGLVTHAGGWGSHLVDVARSLGVPTVSGCRLAERLDSAAAHPPLVAVDGDTGVVALMDG